MPVIEPTEIILDKPRKFLINHRALFRAETKINQLRGGDHALIHLLMVEGFNRNGRTGALPLDLAMVMLWAGLSYAEREPMLSMDQVAELLDSPNAPSFAEICAKIWLAYAAANKKNLETESAPAEDEEKKSSPSTGSNSGPSGGSSLH